MAYSPRRFIVRRSRRLGLDPAAVLAVARGEGGLVDRPGTQDIGDLAGGGSVGPFQLYAQGAFPRSLRHLSLQQRDDWAWSKKGINYALRQIANVASGERGAKAINSIIREFERPADPDTSVRNALARYKSSGGKPGVKGMSNRTFGKGRGGFATGGVPRREALMNFVYANNESFIKTGRVDPSATRNLMTAMRQMEDYGLDGGHAHGDGGIKVSSKAWKSGRKAIIDAMAKAKAMGLSVRENPKYDPVDPVHTEGSYHYQRFRGGVGRAADISGSDAAERKFVNWARNRYGNRIAELFYDPMGGWKHGQSIGAIGGHQHVHIAF